MAVYPTTAVPRHYTEVTHHTYHRRKHIFFLLLDLFVVSFIMIAICFFVFKTTNTDRYYLWKLAQSKSMVTFEPYIKYIPTPPNSKILLAKVPYVDTRCLDDSSRALLKNPNVTCKTQYISAHLLLSEPKADPFLTRMTGILYNAFAFSFFAALIVTLFMAYPLSRLRQVLKRNTLGQQRPLICSAEEMKQLIDKKNQASPFMISGVPFLKGSENSHLLITGEHRQGQSSLFYGLLTQIQSRKQQAIIYDHDGRFVERFYRPGVDIILNPLDKRAPLWNIWVDVKNEFDLQILAKALLPITTHTAEPLFVNMARIIFCSMALRLMSENRLNSAYLLECLLSIRENDIRSMMESADIPVMSEKRVSLATRHVRSIFCKQLEFLKFLKDAEDPFSFQEWAAHHPASCLFITSKAENHRELQPLLSFWMNAAIEARAAVEKQNDQLSWVFIDHLDHLGKCQALKKAQSESSYSGQCFVVSVNTLEDLRQHFDVEGPDFFRLFETSVHFKLHPTPWSQQVSDSLGTYEVTEVNENLTYNAYDDRDQVTAKYHHRSAPIIPIDELSRLPKGEAYLHVAGDWPLAQLVIPDNLLPKIQAAFIQEATTERNLELEAAVKKIQSQTLFFENFNEVS